MEGCEPPAEGDDPPELVTRCLTPGDGPIEVANDDDPDNKYMFQCVYAYDSAYKLAASATVIAATYLLAWDTKNQWLKSL